MHYTRDDKMQTQFRKMEEEIMTKDFLPVVMPVSRMQISIDGKKLNRNFMKIMSYVRSDPLKKK